ncbi:MAG: SPOR domain-containing protein [Sulfuriferula sp.]|nr:SPOR domain-containing protein [Sulfuriferula sp.]
MAIQATSEEQLRLKKRARQRLLGAATLLIGAAIVVPMVLDQAPHPVNSDIAISMPGSEATHVAPAVAAPVPAAVPAPAVVPPAAANPAPVVADKPADTPLPIPIPAPAVADAAHVGAAVHDQADDKSSALKENERKAEAAKAAANAEKQKQEEQAKLAHEKEAAHQAALAAEKAKPPVAQSKPAAAVQPVSADTHAHDAANNHYVVQLGAFSSADNVRQLRERLNAVGVGTYTETLPSGATRVRAGPYAERAQADKVLAKISAAGVHAQIVPLTHK